MIKLPALWHSGQETNWSTPWCSPGCSPRRTGAVHSPPGQGYRGKRSNEAREVCLLRARAYSGVLRSEGLESGFIQTKLCELEDLPPSGSYYTASSTRRGLTQSSPFLKMGNRNSSPSRVTGLTSSIKGKISYRSNGISYEKQDGAAYSTQSRKLEPLKPQMLIERSTQTSGNPQQKHVKSPISSFAVGKPAALRGGSPGPGTYSRMSRSGSPSNTNTMESRPLDKARHNRSRSPKQAGDPGFSLSPRVVQLSQSRSPGPGAYNVPGTLNGPAYTMSPRFKSSKNGPGPGHGSPRFHPSGPVFTIIGKGSKGERSPDLLDSVSPNFHADDPGHGAYAALKPWQKDEKKEKQEKRRESKQILEQVEQKEETKKDEQRELIVKVNSTGAAYKITPTGTFLLAEPPDDTLSNKSLSPRRSESRRRSSSPRRPSSSLRRPSKSPAPGPGDYQRIEYKSDGPSISFKSRIPSLSGNKSPGPGSYEVRSRPSSPSFSFGSRISLPNEAASRPGPGTYTVRSKPHGPSFTMGGKLPDSLRRSRSPGPVYKYDNKTVGNQMPQFTITGKPRPPSRSEVPGPDTYRAPSSFQGPSFSMKSRLSPPKTPESPGPGAYNPRKTTSAPSFTMRGRVERPSGHDTPGPGSYSSRSSMDGPSFSMLGRLSSPTSSSRSSYPGPGAYPIVSRPTSPSFSIYGQLKRRDDNDVPGPGTYSPRLGRDSPVFSMRGRIPVMERSRSPGPAAYNVRGRTNSGRSSPSFSIGGKLSPIERPRSPGPGAYTLPSPHDAPSFSIYGRVRKPQEPTTPGPGAYNPSDALTRFPTPPKFSFGYSFRM